MELITAGVLGHIGSAAGYLLLGLLVLYWWNGTLASALLVTASLTTALWGAVVAYQLHSGIVDGSLAQVLEIVRNCGWMLLLLGLLYWLPPLQRSSLAFAIVGAAILVGALTLFFGRHTASGDANARQLVVILAHIAFAISGMALAENLFRNSPAARYWNIKYLCLGAGALFAFDFFLYSDALLFRHLDRDLYIARGTTTLLIAPLLAVYAARNRKTAPQLALSRGLAFHSATLVGAGLYLMTMAAAGYYVRQFGGTWSSFLQTVFFFGAVLLLVVPISSGSFRAYLRVLVEKSFFKYKYDYRAEWLRLIRTISVTGDGEGLRNRVVRAVCEIMQSPEGALWLEREGRFALATIWNTSRWKLVESETAIALDSPLVRFLERTQWTVDLDEFARTPGRYEGLTELPRWLSGMERVWLIVPLIHHTRLFGVVLVGRPRVDSKLSWEDFDMLKTVGRQAASYLAQQESDEALAEARQFEAFNKRFAFVAHDIKNLVSQLSLILANAARHHDNAEFQKDMIETVRQSVDKLNRMLRQLNTQPPRYEAARAVPLAPLLEDVVARRQALHGAVSLELQTTKAIVTADEERLKAVVEHLVQNAIDAVGEKGHVQVRLGGTGEMATVEIEDDGPGMDGNFIREKLFRPFATTKSSGFGIGVYESREYAKSLGGRLDVTSEPGRGTIMRISLPMAAAK